MWPKSAAEVSQEFLSSILIRPVQSFSWEQTAIQGGCSYLYCFTVISESFPPARLYFKFPLTPDDPSRNVSNNRDMLVRVGAYRKEISFYRFLKGSPHVALVPPIYFAEIDHSAQDEFLLVLGEAGRALDQLHDCPRDTSRQVMSQLARLHALFVNASSVKLEEAGLSVCATPSHTLISRVSGLPDEATAEEVLRFCLDNFVSKFHDFSAVMYAIGDSEISSMLPDVLKLIEGGEALKRIETAFSTSFVSPAFRILIHGDFRPDNLLVNEANGGEVKIIDFQACAFGHPSYDLAQFLCQSHDNLTEELFDELLTIYYNTLCENEPAVGSLTSLSELKATVQAATVFQLLMLSFHCAPLRAAIDGETGKLPDTFGRFLPLLCSVTRRGLRVFLAEQRRFF